VVVSGTSGDDSLILMRTAGGQPGDVTYSLNGATPVLLHGVTSFTFNGGAGNDSMTVSLANGGPLVSGVVVFDGGTSSDTLNLDAAGLPVGISPGSFSVAGQAVSFSNVAATHVNNAAAADAFAGPDTADRSTAFTGLSAQERFVQALYLDVLGRAGMQSELDSWLPVLAGPGGQQGVAAGIEGRFEARDHLVKSWYLHYLGRPANGTEELGWVGLLQAGQTEEQVLSGILASQEFYNRAQTLGFGDTAAGNYVRALYQLLLNRTAGSAEVAGWESALSSVGRQGVGLGFLQSTECRTNQVEGYYEALLHRPADPASLNAWTSSGLDLVSVRIGFEASSEFFSNG
jgi:hypothetical protein